ncbi:MAG: protein SCO1/2 [Rhodothermales bacterium]|jgi:protein SCO1/2
MLSAGPVQDPTAFPGNRIRTAVPAAPFGLINQESDPVALEDFRGDVVLVTAVYGTCEDTCPLIFRQIKSAVALLTEAERRDLHVIAFTLDPETDTPEMLAMMTKVHGVEAPLFNTVTGDPAYVNQVLDRYDFRRWPGANGVIEHTNLIQVIDRNGDIAFRFTLGALQESWLTESLRLVLAEPLAS